MVFEHACVYVGMRGCRRESAGDEGTGCACVWSGVRVETNIHFVCHRVEGVHVCACVCACV